jgi:alpha-ketoglutarate-dependent taurine dioxygenase
MDHITDFIDVIEYSTPQEIQSRVIKNIGKKLLFVVNNINFDNINQLKDFSSKIGSVIKFGDLSGNFSDIQLVKKNPQDRKSYGGWYYLNTEGFGDWHYDGVASQDIYSHTCLYGHSLPGSHRGDTIFSFTNLALADLSKCYQNLLVDLKITHVQRPIKQWPQEWFERMFKYHDFDHLFKKTSRSLISQWHDFRGIYISPSRAWKIEDMHEEESQGIIDFLSRHIVRNEYCYRHAWKSNQLIIWNNWITLHYPVNDYECDQREMWRVCIDHQ